MNTVAAGHDRAFRLFSVIQDQQSRELSQKHTAKRAKKLHVREEDLKLPCVIDMAACQVGAASYRTAISHIEAVAACVRCTGATHVTTALLFGCARCVSETGAMSSPLIRAPQLRTPGS